MSDEGVLGGSAQRARSQFRGTMHFRGYCVGLDAKPIGGTCRLKCKLTKHVAVVRVWSIFHTPLEKVSQYGAVASKTGLLERKCAVAPMPRIFPTKGVRRGIPEHARPYVRGSMHFWGYCSRGVDKTTPGT